MEQLKKEALAQESKKSTEEIQERINQLAVDRMLKWFEYKHLPESLQTVSRPFGELAETICKEIDGGPERTVALRKLLEAKDAAVRAVVHPGG